MAIINGTAGDDTLEGTSSSDQIHGFAGDDVLDGGSGNDTLDGGDGIDTASYASAARAVVVSLALEGTAQQTIGDGKDTLISIENLIGSAFNDTLSAGAAAAWIQGGAGDDLLSGGPGNDTLDGGSGFDAASYANAASGVTVNLNQQGVAQATGGAGHDILISIEAVKGSNFNDVLTADNNGDRLSGGGGNDSIFGGGGDDSLDGGTGVNLVSYASATAAVTVSLAIHTAQNTVGAGNDTLVNFSKLIGSAFSDALTGDNNNNLLQGGGGDDTLDPGGAGNDTLDGGTGVNTASYASFAHGVTVSLGLEGSGQAIGGSAHDTLLNIQNLVGSAFDDTLAAGGSAAWIQGGGGGDLLVGGPGNDTLDGGLGLDEASFANATSAVWVNLNDEGAAQNTYGGGNDTLISIEGVVGSNFDDVLVANGAGDVLNGGAGNDTLSSGSGSDLLIGGDGADHLVGGSGDDVIIGGAGKDTLDAGSGHDTFLYAAASDSPASAPDTIGYFKSGVDKIDLSQVDADVTAKGLQHFHIVSAFTDTPGELVLAQKSGIWLVEGDVNGNGTPDLVIHVATSSLSASDLIL